MNLSMSSKKTTVYVLWNWQRVIEVQSSGTVAPNMFFGILWTWFLVLARLRERKSTSMVPSFLGQPVSHPSRQPDMFNKKCGVQPVWDYPISREVGLLPAWKWGNFSGFNKELGSKRLKSGTQFPAVFLSHRCSHNVVGQLLWATLMNITFWMGHSPRNIIKNHVAASDSPMHDEG